MTFSKEDKAAWLNSEIMKEFEKLALETDVLNGPPVEAFQPIETENEEEKTWEEESNEDKLLSAIEELGISDETEEDLNKELGQAYARNLITNLQKMAYNLATNSKMKAAYRIERTIMKIENVRGGR